jgi:uncharacterized protein with PQ loop repeat
VSNLIGYLAAFLLAICGVPQAYRSYKQGHSQGLDPMFIWTWFTGEVLMLVYILKDLDFNGPLVVNYLMNILALVIILKYLYFPRRNDA